MRFAEIFTLGFLLAVWPPAAQPSRDALERIVAQCLDPSAADYCSRCPSPVAGHCAASDDCHRTTEVWAQTGEYVAIRDLRMCGCPAGYVHGLVMPRTPVSGVEDPKRPAGIWAFAWAAARQRIPEEAEIGLAVNPADRRSQDYLHIHILRLRQEARKGLMSRAPVTVERLEEVWGAGARHAARLGLRSYGMMVAAASGGKFMVLADSGSPAREYTQYDCR